MRLTVSLPPEVASKIKAEAVANDRSESGQVRWILMQHYSVDIEKDKKRAEWITAATRPKDHKPCASATCPVCR